MRACSTVSAAVPPSSPVATPSSIALVNTKGRGSGITVNDTAAGPRYGFTGAARPAGTGHASTAAATTGARSGNRSPRS